MRQEVCRLYSVGCQKRGERGEREERERREKEREREREKVALQGEMRNSV